MGRTLTNSTALAVARQQSKGVLGGSPTWFGLEPNNITQLGPQLESVSRNPISKNRQRRKGGVVGLSSGFEYEADTTIDVLQLFLESFFMSTAVNGDLTFIGRNVGAGGYSIPAASAEQASRLQFTSGGPISLVYGAGYANAANNGLKPLSADTAAAGTTIAFAGAVVETAPTNAQISLAGIRAEAGDLALSISGTVGTLSSGNGSSTNPIDFTTLGIVKGMRIHIGGLTSANRFFGVGPVESYGGARVRTVEADEITIDKMDATLVASDGTTTGAGGTEVAVDLLFGRFVRNVPVDSSEFLELYQQFEAEYPNLFETEPPTPVAEPDGYEYAVDNLSNTMEWAMALKDKSTVTFGFVGTDTEAPVDGASRKTNADSPITPLFTGMLNTSSDFARLRLEDVDEEGLSTDFKELTVSINNNVGPEEVLGLLGAKYLNYGNFEVDIETVLLFTSGLVPARIRDNTTVSMDWMLTNDDGAVHTDIPSMTISSDGREFPVNESIRINLTGTPFMDSFFGTSIGVSIFPVYPTE